MKINIAFAGMTLLFLTSWGHTDAYDTLLKRYEREIQQQERQLRSLKDRLSDKERAAANWQRRAEEAKGLWTKARAAVDSAGRTVERAREHKRQVRVQADAAEWNATEQRLMAQTSDEQLAYWIREYYVHQTVVKPAGLTLADRMPEYLAAHLGSFSQTAHEQAKQARQQETSLRTQEMRWQTEERRRVSELDKFHQKQQAEWLKWQEAQRRRAALVEEISQMEQSRQALRVMLQELQEHREHALASRQDRPRDDRALAAIRGTLPWPAYGRVTQNFGRQYSEELKQLMVSNGIKIEAGTGRTVRAIQAGKVLFASPFRQYGQLVIVQHPNGLTSVYGGLGTTRLKEGDPVSTLDAIGTIANDGHFYFELRHDEQPINPLVYLTPNTHHTDVSLRRTYE